MFGCVVSCIYLDRMKCLVIVAKAGRVSFAKRLRNSTGFGASGETTWQ
jgi:hypothetical protein